ncbi:MAG: ABC transporter ATP-binding protein [[Ruminococcus] lactaris]|uniref:ABC transporter ATP-binding protein n=1 Tax=[Ruminococcus] lactaris TaxID=46228 RepID=UPI0039A160F1
MEKGQKLRAVDNVSLDIKRGETLGLVGESGCGKSTFGRCVLRLIEPTEGKVLYENKDLLQFSKDEMRKMRRKLQMVFQDPYASLNPRMTVMEIIKAPLDVYKIGTKEERIEKVLEMAKIVGLNADAMNRYPHEFSGGQRQRIVIARALILNPEFIVCDEPVSALDVSIRSQVLNLIHDIQKKYNLSYLFISHDLSVVKHISDRVAVMYLGSIVEIAEKNELFSNPLHPYTQALLSAIPIPDVDAERKQIYLEGEVPSPLNPPSGCRFHTRCQYASQKCRELRPELNDIGNGHCIACHCAGKEKER